MQERCPVVVISIFSMVLRWTVCVKIEMSDGGMASCSMKWSCPVGRGVTTVCISSSQYHKVKPVSTPRYGFENPGLWGLENGEYERKGGAKEGVGTDHTGWQWQTNLEPRFIIYNLLSKSYQKIYWLIDIQDYLLMTIRSMFYEDPESVEQQLLILQKISFSSWIILT